ncbi:MAG TPA: hypothetical protein VI750_13025 [Pyrinomonadaceae bacterium]|nr:hypothetical protein [Pyrinomonadaceae bacterium]
MTIRVRAPATNFNHARVFGIFAVLTAVFAVLTRLTITCGVSAFFLILCHKAAFPYGAVRTTIVRCLSASVKTIGLPS